jgi:hypothetical chaperone protein
MQRSSLHCGLDFGTSNSTFGIARGNASGRTAAARGRQDHHPSSIFFDFEADETLFGRAAIAAYVEGNDGRMMRSLKIDPRQPAGR